MRQCKRCNRTQEINQFFRENYLCYSCVNVKRRERNAKNRKNVKCKNCETFFNLIGSQKFCSLKCKLLNNININNDCWEWKRSYTNCGYGKIAHEKKHLLAHRVSYEIHKGEISKGLLVCHSCDNKKCVNPDHLWLGTQKDNIQDAKQKGRLPKQFGRKHTNETKEKFKTRPHSDRRGEKHHLSKLKNEDVFQIRDMLKIGVKNKVIAEKFGVNTGVISNINTGKSWNHI